MRQNGSERMGAGGVRFRGHRPGMTMIELIVVLAILALMSAIAIPTFARLGYFSRNDLQATARELHSMLKAAKIYAATYRVNTAVAYSLATLDSIDAAGLVYKLPAPIVDHAYNESDGTRLSGDVYVPINTTETGAFFRPTKPDTAVLPDGPDNDDLRLTLTPIKIYRV
ncbi:MAG TPA: prepilin-type N-terminal cleavage/methylation domain-containing protein, partial [Candidatus Hydrogenedentes bacterium]|nr:prepilin-type N-terminal cleavage/methylation domain-containing protein [Candidatus Hydrogenedentota bacterium]